MAVAGLLKLFLVRGINCTYKAKLQLSFEGVHVAVIERFVSCQWVTSNNEVTGGWFLITSLVKASIAPEGINFYTSFGSTFFKIRLMIRKCFGSIFSMQYSQFNNYMYYQVCNLQ